MANIYYSSYPLASPLLSVRMQTRARSPSMCVAGCVLSAICGTLLSKNRGAESTKHQMGNIVFSSCSSKRFSSSPFSLISLSRCRCRSQNELYFCCWATDFWPVWKPLFWKIGYLKAANNKTSTSTDQIRCPIFIVVAVDVAIIAHAPQMMRRGGHTEHTSDRFHLVLFPFLFAWHMSSVSFDMTCVHTEARARNKMDSGHKRNEKQRRRVHHTSRT